MKRSSKLLKPAVLAVSAGTILAADMALAQGQRNCAPRELVVGRRADGYGETRQARGLGAIKSASEAFASDETGTWTITVTTPNGVTCLVASGQAFEELAAALPAKGNDA